MIYSKYRNQKVIINGIKIADSKKEDKRLNELRLLERAGEIKELHTQVRFELQPSYKIGNKTIRKIEYICDFLYYDNIIKKQIVEDVKSSNKFQTEVYRLKKKLFMYKYKMEIKEIY